MRVDKLIKLTKQPLSNYLKVCDSMKILQGRLFFYGLRQSFVGIHKARKAHIMQSLSRRKVVPNMFGVKLHAGLQPLGGGRCSSLP